MGVDHTGRWTDVPGGAVPSEYFQGSVDVTDSETITKGGFYPKDATAGNVTVTLMAASAEIAGMSVVVKKSDSSSNLVRLATADSATIDGSPTFSLSVQYQSVRVVCDGVNWAVFTVNSELAAVLGSTTSGLGASLVAIEDSAGDYTGADVEAALTEVPVLAGRATGQTIIGGTAASDGLVLQSTSHATKGSVQVQDPFVVKSHTTGASGAGAKMTRTGYKQTVNNTPQACTEVGIPVADGTIVGVEATFVGRDQAGAERCFYKTAGLYYREGAGPLLQGALAAIFAVESSVNLAAGFTVSGNTLIPLVTGLLATTIDWYVTVEYTVASAP